MTDNEKTEHGRVIDAALKTIHDEFRSEVQAQRRIQVEQQIAGLERMIEQLEKTLDD